MLQTYYDYLFSNCRFPMAMVLVSSSVERRFESRLGQTKDYAIGICYFSAKHVALRSNNKDQTHFRYVLCN
jgi:hypothetical protein